MSAKSYPLMCRIKAEGTVTRLDILDDIGADPWFGGGISAADVAGQLAGARGPLDVHISSAGGVVGDGLAIFNALAAYPGPVTTYIDGYALSVASVIAQAGQKRVASPVSAVMIHDAWGSEDGDQAAMLRMAEALGTNSDVIARAYADRAGGTVDEWRAAMQKTTWYTADEALAAGLVDEIAGGSQLPAGLDLDSLAASAPTRIMARLRAAMPQAAARTEPPVAETGKPDGKQEFPPGRLYARDGRLLGLESMPVADKALAVHHTATEETAWNGPAAVAAMPNDDTVLEYCHAWQSDEAASVPHREGDDDADDQKGNYKFPHHEHKGGAANVNACSNGLARLPGASIPDADRAGVEAHLRAHLKDAGHGEDDAEDSAHLDLSGVDLEQLGSALKEAIK